MKFILIILSLFVFEVSLAQDQVSVVSNDRKIKYNCPKDPDETTVRYMIENYIEATRLGHTRPSFVKFVKKECLNTPLPYPYKIAIPEPMFNDNSHFPKPFFITHHEIKNVRKTGSSSYSYKYTVDVEIKGRNMSGKSIEFVDRVFFRINKGEEAELLGCVWLYGGWEDPFIDERCYNKNKDTH